MADTMKRTRSAKGATAVGNRPRARRKPGEVALRREVIATALEMSRSGLSPGRSGNVSCRFADGMLITPSGMAYDMLEPADIVAVDANGGVAAGQRKPSSEWRFHLDAYAARPDRNAVVHTHSLHATVLACAHQPIPAFHYMVAVAGGDTVRCAPYATFGTQELSDQVQAALAGRKACLMANHGLLCVASEPAGALDLAVEIESLARAYLQCLAVGEPAILDAAEMERVLEKFRDYGAG